MKSDYFEKLKHPKWQERRLSIMRRDEFKCVSCNDRESQLNVHHAYYVSGRMPWEYPDFSLCTLCRNCHSQKHEELLLRREENEGKIVYEEWETALNWTVDAQAGWEGFSQFWDIAAQIAQATEEGIDRKLLFKFIEKAILGLRQENYHRSPK
jgi:hypothetical protein